MTSLIRVLFHAILAGVIIENSVAAVARPEIDSQAKVKQHRRPNGDLIQGEEDKRKILVKWEKIPEAEKYELCHNCPYIDEDGEEILEEGNAVTKSGEEGEVIPIGLGRDYECGGLACLLMPDSPKGYNKFHLRVFKKGDWSPWSKRRNFNVDKPGYIEHEELY